VNAAIEHASQADGIEIQARLDEGRVVVEIISLGADKVSSLFDQVDVQTLRGDIAALQSALDRHLVHALVAYTGAKVWATPLPETGFSIYLALPLSAPPIPVKAEGVEHRQLETSVKTQGKGGSRRKNDAFTVLVADDERAMSDLLRHHLESAGY